MFFIEGILVQDTRLVAWLQTLVILAELLIEVFASVHRLLESAAVLRLELDRVLVGRHLEAWLG